MADLKSFNEFISMDESDNLREFPQEKDNPMSLMKDFPSVSLIKAISRSSNMAFKTAFMLIGEAVRSERTKILVPKEAMDLRERYNLEESLKALGYKVERRTNGTGTEVSW